MRCSALFTDREDWNQIQGTRRDFDAMGRATRTDFGETGSTPPVEFGVVYHPPQIVWGAEFGHMLSHGFTWAKWTESHDLYEGGQRRYYDFGSRLLARAIDRGYWSTEDPPPPGGGGEEEMMKSGGEGGEESMSGGGFEMNAGGGGTTHLYLWWEGLRREHYAQLGWNDVAQWHVDEDAGSAPFGLNRWLDWGIYHAGGLDSLLGSTRWVQSPAEQDDYAATELFFVRDHLGSPALAMQAKRTLVSGETYRWELQPVESYEYAPYGDPTIHVPATDGSPQSAGRLALKETGAFSMTGEKSTESLLDRNDVGRPNGSSGNTWTRNGAVPVATSFLGWSHLFTGRPWDADVRQYHIRHRWYEPLTGRWTAVDPIGYSGGLHQYLYCEASPTQFLDPSGMIVVAIGGTGSQRDQSDGYEPIPFLFGERLANPGETILKLHGPDSGYDGENEKGWKILKVTYDKATKECQTIHTFAIDAIREARRKNPNERVIIIGHSRGGSIANQIASDLGGVDGLILLDPKRNLGPNSSMLGEIDVSSDVVFLAESSPLPQSSVPNTRAMNPDTNSSRDEFEDVIPTYPYPENGNQLYHELFHLSHGAFGGNPNVPKNDACEHTADSNQDGLAELQKWFNDTVIPNLNGG